MTWLCSSLYIALLYGGTITTPWHTAQDISGPAVDLQSCPEGIGARLAASPHYVQVGPQFGYAVPLSGSWSLTLQTHGGLGYSNTRNPTTKLRQVTLLNFGVSGLLRYREHWSLQVGYDHMSRGRGDDPTNAGQDVWTVGIGYRY